MNDLLHGRRRMGRRWAERIAAACGVTVGWLLGETPEARAVAAIPTYDYVGGGHHFVVAEGARSYETQVPDSLVGFRVRGDSMRPLARDGQIVMALKDVAAVSGDLAYVEMEDGTATFKRLQIEGNRVILRPIDPDHPVVTVARSQVRRAWKVWGVKF